MLKALSGLLIPILLTAAEASAQDTPPPVHFEAEYSETDVNTGNAVLRRNVVIERGDLALRADRAVATSDGERYRLFELTGTPVRWSDVLDSGEPIEGEARIVIYDVAARTITLRDAAVIRHPRGRVNGNELVYDLDTERLTGQRADGENVRWLIEPDALESAREDTGDDPDGDGGTDG